VAKEETKECKIKEEEHITIEDMKKQHDIIINELKL
jgi:hypothetical protein